jgi:hypothetical protein
VGEPFTIPGDADAEALERGREELDRRLRNLEARAGTLL